MRITAGPSRQRLTGLPWPPSRTLLIPSPLNSFGLMVTDEVAQLAASGYRIVSFSAHVRSGP